jgi:hypothetical protein
MNEHSVEQVGDWPMYDKDLGTTNAELGRGLRKKVLLGEFDSEPTDREMIQAYKVSGLGVDEFLDSWKQ